jgi:transposase
MVPHSEDLRQRIINAWKKNGASTEQLAERFDVGSATVKRLKRLYVETGGVAPRPHGGGTPRKIKAHQEKLVEALVQQHPDWTEERYAAALRKEHGIQASDVTVGRVIRRLGYSVKKKRSSRPKETGKTSAVDGSSTSGKLEQSPLRVWFLWTKRARTSR